MEENPLSLVSDGVVRAIKFSISTSEEICKYSINDCPISHPSQLTNPFLGLPLESGKCEACGTAEIGQCEGHFGYIQLPIPVYHPLHISELKRILTFLCLKCMRMKKGKVKGKAGQEKVSTTQCPYCRDLPQISIKDVKKSDGTCCLELSVPSRTRMRDGFWSFLDKFGFRYGDSSCRPLLPIEVLNILKEIPAETEKKLSAKGYIPQKGYILQYLPVPPNCLLVPEISDGKSIMSSDISISLLRRILNKIELIKKSRSGSPNFESHEVESSDLQLAIAEYMDLRGTSKTPHATRKFAVANESAENSSKQWLEKMRTLFIRKGSGFSSRSVITGDAYIGVHQIGLPSEIAKRVTFEERVTEYNIQHLQKMVDDGLCVTYKDGRSTYAIAVGSRGHTNLKVGQIINRSIKDGDIVFINRPPSTHKHSLQAFSVFVHDDHTVKINPLVCAPLGADFDGDCIHIFYPQSLAAKAEVVELFSVEQQLLSSHSGQLNFEVANDSLLSLKLMTKESFFRRARAQQLGMLVSAVFPPPAIFKAASSGPLWTIHQILQSALPPSVDFLGERHVISQSEILKFDFSRDMLQTSLTEIITSVLFTKGSKEALCFFNMLQPLLMEILFLDGFSISLKDFEVPKTRIEEVKKGLQELSSLLGPLRSAYNEFMEFQFDNHLKSLKVPFTSYIVQGSSLGYLTDSKSESAISKVLQQVGFLGPQLFDKGKLYSRSLVQSVYSHFVGKYSVGADPPCEAYGLVKNSFFNGLNPYEDLVHSISTREIILRSSRGLTEPGTLFKNLMAILRDVVVCYDRTVRNACSNSLIQFEYELDNEADSLSMSPAGEPVGVLAATAISTPAYKAVLDSSNSTNSAWNLMKEILLCKAGYRNDVMDRRVILYLNDCCCGKKFCKENAALAVSNCLRKVTLKECASYFTIEYQKNITLSNSSEISSGLVGHVHLDMSLLQRCNQSAEEILQKCQEVVTGYKRKKKGNLSHIFRRLVLSASECCTFQQSQLPCLQFSYCDGSAGESLEQTMHVMNNTICPILLDTIVKGDPRIHAVNIVWVGPDVTTWVKNPSRSLKGELALEVSVEKVAARRSGDAWSTVLDACLPVMHLLNTTRSIPSGIQQIEEFLGISCAFDQSIRRLSKCLKKGVMREHLILVGSSMTCTGKLIGFNTGGFKALFRSLKVQVPFTEATLYTPMKCFQRAAEKLHSDSLGSVVSSCSWGKHVAVGTGTNFEVLWGQKHQMASNEDIGKDVYDLLAWVREPTERDYAGACLGDDVDDIFEDNENPDNSPERNTGSDPTFEGLEPDCNGSSWEKAATVNVQSDSWQGWGDKDQPTSSWGKTAQPATDNSNTSSWEKVSPAVVESVNDQGWGQSNRTNWEKATTEVIKSDNVEVQKGQPASGWETAQRATKNLNMSSWEKVSSAVVKPGNDQEWGQSKSTSWENATPELAKSGNVDIQKGQPASGWETAQRATNNLNMSSWEKVSSAVVKPGNDQEWGQSKSTSWENATPELAKSGDVDMQKGQPASSWGTAQPANNSNISSWEKVSSRAVNSGNGKEWGQSNRPTWEKATLEVSISENVDVQKGQPASSWETAQPAKDLNISSWEKVSPAVVKSGNDQEWGQSNRTSWEKSTPEVKSDNAEAQKRSVWTANKPEAKSMGWDDCNSGLSEKDESKGWTAQNVEEPATGSSGWNSQGWTSKKPEVDSPSEGKQGWKLGGGWGVKNSSDRRNQQNSSRPTGRPEDRKGWRRAEPFTSEEEKILVIVEPVMSSVRKILRESSDGARLSSEDHKFIIENVFHYHPDKQGKVSGEIDYITVDKHADHKDSRCFYVVSSDGSRADFSYFKCMESFVDGNFPEHAESFKRKFFRRRRAETSNAEPSNVEPSNAEPSNVEPTNAEPLNGDGQQ